MWGVYMVLSCTASHVSCNLNHLSRATKKDSLVLLYIQPFNSNRGTGAHLNLVSTAEELGEGLGCWGRIRGPLGWLLVM